MADAGTWASDADNSTRRSEDMKKKRYAQEEKMKGTFEQQESNKDKRLGLKGEQDRLTQALRNKGSFANQTESSRGALAVQKNRSTNRVAEINAKTPYWNAAANEANSKARMYQFEGDDAKIALNYSDRKHAKAVNLAAPGEPPSQSDDLIAMGRRASLEESLLGEQEDTVYQTGVNLFGGTTFDGTSTDNYNKFTKKKSRIPWQ